MLGINVQWNRNYWTRKSLVSGFSTFPLTTNLMLIQTVKFFYYNLFSFKV